MTSARDSLHAVPAPVTVPEVQGKQLHFPAAGWYVPAGHGLHAVQQH